jgi:FkbM family methyltransferase
MLNRLWRVAAVRLPANLRFELRRANFSRQIRRGTFRSPEPEVAEVEKILRPGDWAIDVGANVGHYTCQMARLVGAAGRVLAFEPIPLSFALLTANLRAAGLVNVSLFNLALSERVGVLRMAVPAYDETGLDNYYRAHIAEQGNYPVLCTPLDAIPVPGVVRLVKVDAEGHDLQVLNGMQSLLARDRPTLIVEGSSGGPAGVWLRERAYSVRALPGSSNIIATPQARASGSSQP